MERAAAAGLALEPDLASHKFYQPLGNREPLPVRPHREHLLRVTQPVAQRERNRLEPQLAREDRRSSPIVPSLWRTRIWIGALNCA
jgi:hypothetical protein